MSQVDLFCRPLSRFLWPIYGSIFQNILRIDQSMLCTNVECSHSRVGGSSWKVGGGEIVDRRQGTDPPGGGCKGQRPWPGNFAFLNSIRALWCRLSTLCRESLNLFPIKVLFFYLFFFFKLWYRPI